MAEISLILRDEGNDVRISHSITREGETAELAQYPATPAMIVALTMIDMFNTGKLEPFMTPLIESVMKRAGLSAEQIEEAKRKGGLAL